MRRDRDTRDASQGRRSHQIPRLPGPQSWTSSPRTARNPCLLSSLPGWGSRLWQLNLVKVPPNFPSSSKNCGPLHPLGRHSLAIGLDVAWKARPGAPSQHRTHTSQGTGKSWALFQVTGARPRSRVKRKETFSAAGPASLGRLRPNR